MVQKKEMFTFKVLRIITFQQPMKLPNSNFKARIIYYARMEMMRRMITKSTMIVVLKHRTLLIIKAAMIPMYKFF